MEAVPFTPLQPIGENIHFWQPREPRVTSDPALIILCTWLGGATPRRIQHYVAGYRAFTLHTRLAPARDVIRRFIGSATGEERSGSILLHIFSHGGCNSAIQSALSLQSDPTHPISDFGRYLCGIIFDCCPGDTSFQRAYQAATHSLPTSLPVQTVGKALLYPIIGIISGLQQTGWMGSVRDLRTQLNDPNVFGATAARLYLYSMADQMVGWEDVVSHQKEAKSELGCAVQGVAFPDGPHCGLVRDHHDQYWDEIQRFWQRREAIGPPELTESMPGNKARSRL
ncbi:hypothetical protein N7488_008018 [Penicillium malachiteum]|nr:hypothetical protein N7488_008018 [Penicillium malachiteum]